MGEVPGGVTPPEVTAEPGDHTAALADEKPVEIKAVEGAEPRRELGALWAGLFGHEGYRAQLRVGRSRPVLGQPWL